MAYELWTFMYERHIILDMFSHSPAVVVLEQV